MAFIDFILAQKYDLALLVLFVILLIWFLRKKVKHIVEQKLIAVLGFPIVSMVMVRTKWGISLMLNWAKKYNGLVRFFGYFSIGIGAIGLVLNIGMLGLIIKAVLDRPELQQVGLVLPFTNIPGLGYLSFTHWIIAIAILATVHEFAHGVVAKAHKIKVKASGVAVLSLFRIPFIPAAFVEPDPKQMEKATHRAQQSVLAAGPVSNLLLAIPVFLLFLGFSMFIATQATEPVGFSFMGVNESLPAAQAGIEANIIYNFIDGVEVDNASALVDTLAQKNPGDVVSIGRYDENKSIVSYTITTMESPTNESRAYIGVLGLINNREFFDNYKPYGELLNWFKDLLRWLFLFNFFIGLMNLMPLYITDGGQMVKLYAQKIFGKNSKWAKRMYSWICSLAFYVLLAAFLVPFFAKFF